MSHDELGDQLKALANASRGDADEPRSRPAHPSPSVSHASDEEDDFITAEVEDESADASRAAHPRANEQAYGFAGHQPAYRSTPGAKPIRKVSELKVITAPLLMIVGLLLLIPAIWAVMILAGANAPMAERDDAPRMARLMLVCWPLSLSLIIPAIFFFVQIAAYRKAIRKR